MSSSLIPSSTSSASASASASGHAAQPTSFKVVGLILAVASGVFIGTSFVIKKKGLLRSQAKSGRAAGEGVSYLKDWMWWIGMSMMILGEIFNFVAYAFVDAVLVTPLGALSVVICAILSHFFLQEKLTLFGWIGCGLCILGSTIIALSAPEQQAVTEIRPFMKLFISPGFLAWMSIVVATALFLVFYGAPRWGTKNMFTHIGICSLIGGLSVSCTQGLGASILTSIRGNNQVTFWFFWFLFVFVIGTLLTEVVFLNKALALFNTALVTPTYYVSFTFCTLLTSIILYQGLKATPAAIVTIVMGFLVVCCGITILQLSKIDPVVLQAQPGVDRRSTLLLAAQRPPEDLEKEITDQEEPGMDALRGGFGAVGSIIRARSRSSIASRHRISASNSNFDPRDPFSLGSMKRYTLTDEPAGMYENAGSAGGGGHGSRGGSGGSGGSDGRSGGGRGPKPGEPVGPNRSRDYAYGEGAGGTRGGDGGRGDGRGGAGADGDLGVKRPRRMSKSRGGFSSTSSSQKTKHQPRSATALTFQNEDTIHQPGRPGHPEDALHSTSYHPTQHAHPSSSSSSIRQTPVASRPSSGSLNNPFIPPSPSSTIRPVPSQNQNQNQRGGPTSTQLYPPRAGSSSFSAADRSGSFASSAAGGRRPSPVDARNQEERSFGTFAEKRGLYDYDEEEEEEYEYGNGNGRGGAGYDGHVRGHGYVDSVDSSRSVDVQNTRRIPQAATLLPYSDSSFNRRPNSHESSNIPLDNRSGARDLGGPPAAPMLSPSRERRDSSRSGQSHRSDYPSLPKKVEATSQHREERRGLVQDKNGRDESEEEDGDDGKGEDESGDGLDDLFIPVVKKR